MRMWTCDPKILCRQHLLGERFEMHMFVGALNKGKSIDGYLKGNLFEPDSLYDRHSCLVQEMKNRGYRHKSSMVFEDISEKLKNLKAEDRGKKIDKDKSLKDLLNRCPQCRERFGGVELYNQFLGEYKTFAN